MDLQWWDEGREGRFGEYIDHLSRVLGHADRVEPFQAYCTGLLIPGERKSVEPMAARLSPQRVAAAHQSLLHFVGQSGWDDGALLRAVRDWVLPKLGAIEAWIVDDTGFPKKGKHSVGVTRQYCGQLGKQDNCQVAVTLSVATAQASLPIDYRLYLPEVWAADAARRGKAGVPVDEVLRTKPEIALSQIRTAVEDGVAPGVVLADAGYGADTEFRSGISALGLQYVAGILPNTTVWAPGTGPLPPAPGSGRGRRQTRLRRDADHQPQAVKALALALPATAWQTVTWRQGTAEALRSRFARVRVRPAHRDHTRSEPWPEEWLLIEWPEGEDEPTKYWFSTMPETVSLERLVTLAKLRWRIERDYLELKQELGLGHFEGRGWRGFHHHASLCIAAYGFLVSERSAFPPSGSAHGRLIKAPPLSDGGRPRGATDPAGKTRPRLHRHAPRPSHRRPAQRPIPMPMLPKNLPDNTENARFDELVTQ
jgi:SRSO17 transposase